MGIRSRAAAVAGGLVLSIVPGVAAGAAPGSPSPFYYSGVVPRECFSQDRSVLAPTGTLIDIYITNGTTQRINTYVRNELGQRAVPAFVNPGQSLRAYRTRNERLIEITDDSLRCLGMFEVRTIKLRADIVYR